MYLHYARTIRIQDFTADQSVGFFFIPMKTSGIEPYHFINGRSGSFIEIYRCLFLKSTPKPSEYEKGFNCLSI